MLHNVRSLDTGNCDFEKILGMEGIYIANIYDHYEVDKLKSRMDSTIDHLEPYKRTVYYGNSHIISTSPMTEAVTGIR